MGRTPDEWRILGDIHTIGPTRELLTPSFTLDLDSRMMLLVDCDIALSRLKLGLVIMKSPSSDCYLVALVTLFVT